MAAGGGKVQRAAGEGAVAMDQARNGTGVEDQPSGSCRAGRRAMSKVMFKISWTEVITDSSGTLAVTVEVAAMSGA